MESIKFFVFWRIKQLFVTAFARERIILKDPELSFDYVVTLLWQIIEELLRIFIDKNTEVYHFIATNRPLFSMRSISSNSRFFFSLSIIPSKR